MRQKRILKNKPAYGSRFGSDTLVFPNTCWRVMIPNKIPLWKPKGGATIAELNALVEKYYGNPDDVSDVARARKIRHYGAHQGETEIKLSGCSTRHFEYAHIDGNTDNAYMIGIFLNLLDGWGIENFSPTTAHRLANLTKVAKAPQTPMEAPCKPLPKPSAAENNILWHPRLSAEVYQSPRIRQSRLYANILAVL
ncbi:MAG: hypothetical protein R3C26_17860 [Calditrichia bacterium]